MKKKIISLAVAAMLVISSATTAFAASSIIAVPGSDSTTVKGTYVPGASVDTVYKVEVEWGSMEFTYNAASQGTWDPDTHKYEGGTTNTGWTCDEENGANKITITNHSNAMVVASLNFTPDNNDIQMAFINEIGDSLSGVTLNSADSNLDENGVGKAETSSLLATITNGSISESGTLGTITITIRPHQ